MTKEAIKTFSYRITQATRSQLVVILYDMALDYVDEAITTDDDMILKKNLQMASRVIDQLLTGLDMKYEISWNLFQIYNHIKRTFISTSVDCNRNELERVKKLLVKLRGAFYEVSKLDDSEPLMKNTETVYAGLTYSKGGSSNETSSTDLLNRGFKA